VFLDNAGGSQALGDVIDSYGLRPCLMKYVTNIPV
jgi:hypothetical protein